MGTLMTKSAAPAARRFPPQLRLREKITLPYVVLAALAGALAAFILTQLLVASVDERFQRQLQDSALQAADEHVRVEQEQLALWRQIRYTVGFDAAVRARDGAGAGALAALPQFNSTVDAVDVVDAAGAGLWAMHRRSQEPQTFDFTPFADYAAWPLVQTALAGRGDAAGDKYVQVVMAGGEAWLYTAGPVVDGAGVAGVLLVGARLAHTAQRLDQAALARVTLYAPDGRPLASTLEGSAVAALDAPALDDLAGGSVLRRLTAGGYPYTEIVIPWRVRAGERMGALGVAQLNETITAVTYPTQQFLLTLIGAGIAVILLIGALVAVQITRPVQQLVQASRDVAGGDLDRHVAVESGDEIGELGQAFNHMVERLRERQMLINLFGHYVGDSIRDEILNGRVRLGGERRQVTIVFADIRDFSTLTARSDPQGLLGMLNEYFAEMIVAIERHGGLVNKFGGDSLLAVFGLPLNDDRHAQNGLQAAIEMTRHLAQLNLRRAMRGDLPIRIGIGVNSGEVIAGNVGSAERLEYTVIGEPVNLAERLSELNKTGDSHSIFISASTVAQLGPWGDELARDQPLADLGPLPIRGKAEPVRVYAYA
jgi:class 3 adenylate cyclase